MIIVTIIAVVDEVVIVMLTMRLREGRSALQNKEEGDEEMLGRRR